MLVMRGALYPLDLAHITLMEDLGNYLHNWKFSTSPQLLELSGGRFLNLDDHHNLQGSFYFVWVNITIWQCVCPPGKKKHHFWFKFLSPEWLFFQNKDAHILPLEILIQ